MPQGRPTTTRTMEDCQMRLYMIVCRELLVKREPHLIYYIVRMAKWEAEGRPETDSDDENDERLPDETERVIL